MALENGLPQNDGEWTRYTAKTNPSGSMRHPIIYVNGMNTSPEAHADAAIKFVAEFKQDVFGCYNRLGNAVSLSVTRMIADLQRALAHVHMPDVLGQLLVSVCQKYLGLADSANNVVALLSDVSQCMDDWSAPLTSAAVQAAPGAVRKAASTAELALLQGAFGPIFGPLFAQSAKRAINNAVRNATPTLITEADKTAIKLRIARFLLSHNQASVSLFDTLYRLQGRGGIVRIICHSQGNLITANTLTMLNWVCHQHSPMQFRVWALASPVNALGWPTNMPRMILHRYTNSQDFVTWLSLGESYRKSSVFNGKTGVNLNAHAIGTYASRPEFILSLKRDMGQ